MDVLALAVGCLGLLAACLVHFRGRTEDKRFSHRLRALEAEIRELKRGLARVESQLAEHLERERKSKADSSLPIAGIASAIAGGNRAALISSLFLLGSRLFATYWRRKEQPRLPEKTVWEEHDG